MFHVKHQKGVSFSTRQHKRRIFYYDHSRGHKRFWAYRTSIDERYSRDLEVIAVNDLTDTKTNAHLLKYDSTYGRFPDEIEATADSLIVNGHTIKVLAQRDPAQIPWGELGIDIVIESTGFFTDADKAAAHLR